MFAAGEVRAAGWGGLEAVSEITGLARSTIGRGQKDLDAAPLPRGRVRRKGGGRRHLSSRDATLIEDLRSVIAPATLGDPMRPLLWVSKSHDKVAVAMQKKGHEISASSVKRLLPRLGYSRQSNRKADEGSKHPDRNAQFEHINAKAIAAQATGQPVISVDTKKKELIGNYKNGGTDYRPKGDPQRVTPNQEQYHFAKMYLLVGQACASAGTAADARLTCVTKSRRVINMSPPTWSSGCRPSPCGMRGV